jgi:ankyrin repeat protein
MMDIEKIFKIAFEQNNKTVIDFLINECKYINWSGCDLELLENHVSTKKCRIIDNQGENALFKACRNRNTNLVKLLLKYMLPEDVRIVNKYDIPAIFCKTKTEIHKLLLPYYQAKNIKSINTYTGQTILEKNINNIDSLKLFLPYYSEEELINIKTSYKGSLFEFALYWDQPEVFKLLISMLSDENINFKNDNGDTLLHTVCKSRYPRLAKLLLDRFSIDDVNAKNKNGKTADYYLKITAKETKKLINYYMNNKTYKIIIPDYAENIIIERE